MVKIKQFLVVSNTVVKIKQFLVIINMVVKINIYIICKFPFPFVLLILSISEFSINDFM